MELGRVAAVTLSKSAAKLGLLIDYGNDDQVNSLAPTAFTHGHSFLSSFREMGVEYMCSTETNKASSLWLPQSETRSFLVKNGRLFLPF